MSATLILLSAGVSGMELFLACRSLRNDDMGFTRSRFLLVVEWVESESGSGWGLGVALALTLPLCSYIFISYPSSTHKIAIIKGNVEDISYLLHC